MVRFVGNTMKVSGAYGTFFHVRREDWFTKKIAENYKLKLSGVGNQELLGVRQNEVHLVRYFDWMWHYEYVEDVRVHATNKA